MQLLPSCKARQVIALRCHFAFVYIYIRPVNTSIAQLLPVLRWRVRQLRAPLRQNMQRICAHKHFNALGCIRIFAGIAYCSVGGLHGSSSRPFWLMSFYPRGRDPFPLLSRGGGGHTSEPHRIRSWATPNKRVAIEKQTHAMVKTKDLYSTLRLSTARLLILMHALVIIAVCQLIH